MTKTLYIHIGTHKTATTAIQNFLTANRERLFAQGIAYPEFPYEYYGKSPTRNGLFLTWPVKDAEGQRDEAEENRRFEECMGTIHGLFSSCDTVILSDEAIWRNLFYKRKDVMEKLLADARSKGYTLKMIIYLRRQDQFLESMWNQMVKMRPDFTTDFEEYVAQYRHKYLYYDEILPWYADGLGDENFIVRRFADSIRGEGIVADFLSIFGLDLTEAYEQGEEEPNIGLYGNTVRIKQLINGTGEMSLAETNMFRNALTMVSPIAQAECPCSEFSEETRAVFMDRFAEGNAAIAKRFFDDGRPLFSEDYRGKPLRENRNQWLTDDAIRGAAAVDLLLYRRQSNHLSLLKEADRRLLDREKEMLVRLKVLERTARRQEKQIASLERRVEHLRHPLRRILEKLRALFSRGKAEEEPEMVSIIEQEMPEEDLPELELPEIDSGEPEEVDSELLEE